MTVAASLSEAKTDPAVAELDPPVPRKRISDRLLTAIDLTATFILAMQAAVFGVQANLDLFGILVLTFVASTGGGILRDLILGEHPPAAFRDGRYTINALIAAAVVIAVGMLHGPISEYMPVMMMKIIGAAGLAFSVVAAAKKAMAFNLHAGSVIVITIVGGCGGGMLRDVLTMRVPGILVADFYATVALLGGLVMLLLVRQLGVSKSLAAAATGGFVFVLRVAAVLGGWSVPHIN